MDKQEKIRLVIAIALTAALMFGWQYVFGPSQEQVEQARQAAEVEQRTAAVLDAPAPVPATDESGFVASKGESVTVDTPLYVATFNSQGGVLESFVLKRFKETTEPDSLNVDLVGEKAAARGALGLFLSRGGDDQVHTWKYGEWALQGGDIVINEQDETKSLTFMGEVHGYKITRVLTFNPTTYLIEETTTVLNGNDTGVEGSLSFHAAAKSMSGEDDMYNPTRVAYLNLEGRDEMEDVDDLQEVGLTASGGLEWGAIVSNYFMFAAAPGSPEAALSANYQDDVYRMALAEDAAFIPNVAKTFSVSYFIGPTDRHMLETMPNQLAEAVNFGWFDFLAKPMLIGLDFFYEYVHNYGVAIILLTIVIKLLFWPLSQKSYESMEQMKKLQPMVQKLREKYGDDKQRMNQETMALYKTYKVNPMGGCLPMIVQIPVFFGLYKALMGAVELRHAPFIENLPFTDIPWLADLSAKDPYYITPLVMGATMFLQQKMTPSAGDPMQQKIMLLMPVIFTFMFLQFPSGLVIYWLMNNVLSIGQQLLIVRAHKKKAEAAEA